MFEQETSLVFIFQTIAVILVCTAIGIYLVNTNKRKK